MKLKELKLSHFKPKREYVKPNTLDKKGAEMELPAWNDPKWRDIGASDAVRPETITVRGTNNLTVYGRRTVYQKSTARVKHRPEQRGSAEWYNHQLKVTADVKPALTEVVHNEDESKMLFRRLLIALTPFADYPFKKEIWHGEPNPWHLTSGSLPVFKHNYINARLVRNRRGKNYVELTVVVPLNDDSTKPLTNHGKDLLNFVNNLSLFTEVCHFVVKRKFNQQGVDAIKRSVKVFDL